MFTDLYINLTKEERKKIDLEKWLYSWYLHKLEEEVKEIKSKRRMLIYNA